MTRSTATARAPKTGGVDMRERFLQGMSQLPSPVSVVTTDGPGGRAGVTVSAVCAVSADPPSLLVCIHHLSPACAAIEQNRLFCVNALRHDQSHVSEVFAGRLAAPNGDKFACAEWQTTRSGLPALRDSLVAFECRVSTTLLEGTHRIFVAEVLRAEPTDGRPLVHANHCYAAPAPLTTRA
jgi:flavin reductase (DIM6/NTAB) family NADH-FMN oxidoreductase RutF